MYIIIRNDLSQAQKAVQGTHAAIESARAFLSPEDEHPSIIMLIVKSEAKLKDTLAKLEPHMRIKTFHEPDRNNELTAIATEPIHGESRKLLSRYQLLY